MTILPDVIALDLDIVFCGTAVGEASAKEKAYYAGPGNAFWPTLHKVGLTPRRFKPGEYKDLLSLRMGLTDLVKSAFGNDDALRTEHFDCDRLKKLISDYHPRIVAFTSKRAGEEFVQRKLDYGELRHEASDVVLFVLPSPSGGARRYWDESYWWELARLRASMNR